MRDPQRHASESRLRVGYLGPSLAQDVVVDALGPEIELIELGLDASRLAEELPALDGLIDASTRVPLDAAALSTADRLKIVSLASTGTSHVDIAAADTAGVEVRSLREDTALLSQLTPAAEHTWALVLACARSLPAAVSHSRSGDWEREQFPGMMLRGRRLGIVGLGRIGGWVARYGAAFGMEVVAHDPDRTDWPSGVAACELADLFATCDVITLHVHLSDQTEGFIGRALLERCRPGTILVNTSRGGVLDEGAVLELLRAGVLGAVGLDVLAEEPPSATNPILLASQESLNLILTPHIGGFSPDAVRLTVGRAAQKVRERLVGPA